MKTPKAPDPQETAAAQGAWNSATAQQNQIMNMTNQVGPDGSLTYNQIGTTTITGGDGKPMQVPRYEAVTQYSPEQQAIADQSNAAALNIGKIAANQSAALDPYLSDRFTFNNQDAADWAYDLGQSRIAPQQQAAQKALETQLVNSGIRRGTAAWDSELARHTNSVTDQNNQLALQGRNMAYNEAIQNRNQPINELTALMSGSQVSAPQFQNTPQTQVAGVDYTGLVNNKYQAELQASQAKMGGLFGLAAAPFSMFKFGSDRRLKDNIKRIGTADNGLGIYQFRYKDDPEKRLNIGYMSDEVKQIMPDAVSKRSDGFEQVDYLMVGGL